MSTYLKLMLAAVTLVVIAVSVMSTSVSAQIYGPYRGYIGNGTGTVPDRFRDPHDDRGAYSGGG
jgi:hypothetical protein